MSHDAGQVCACQADHRPAPMELERHHVWPLGMGGPDEDWNIAWVCPTTHTNIHEMLRAFLRLGPLTWGEVVEATSVPVNRYAYHLAVTGYQRWAQATGHTVAP